MWEGARDSDPDALHLQGPAVLFSCPRAGSGVPSVKREEGTG